MIRKPIPQIVFAALMALAGMAAAFGQTANPFDLRIAPLAVGAPVPGISLIDQRGREFSFESLRGHTVIVGFIYTRCTDACPVITQKFGALDRALDARRFVLVELSVDPKHDRVLQLRRYAQKYGDRSPRWLMATGNPARLLLFERSAGVSVVDDGSGDLVHGSQLLVIDSAGRLAATDDEVAWDPRTVAAEAQHVDGQPSSLLGRADFTLTSAVAQLCGGSYQTASGIVDAVAALVLFASGIFVLGWFGRRFLTQGGG